MEWWKDHFTQWNGQNLITHSFHLTIVTKTRNPQSKTMLTNYLPESTRSWISSKVFRQKHVSHNRDGKDINSDRYGTRQKKLYIPLCFHGVKKTLAWPSFHRLFTVLSPAFYKCISVPRQRWQRSKPAKTPFLQLALGLKAKLAPVSAVCMGQMYRASWPVKRWWEGGFITGGTDLSAVKPLSEHLLSVVWALFERVFLPVVPLNRRENTTVCKVFFDAYRSYVTRFARE